MLAQPTFRGAASQPRTASEKKKEQSKVKKVIKRYMSTTVSATRDTTTVKIINTRTAVTTAYYIEKRW